VAGSLCEFEYHRRRRKNQLAPFLPLAGIHGDQNFKMNLDQYLRVLLFILVGIGLGAVPQVLGFMLGPQQAHVASCLTNAVAGRLKMPG